jgi:hypothetical protein
MVVAIHQISPVAHLPLALGVITNGVSLGQTKKRYWYFTD